MAYLNGKEVLFGAKAVTVVNEGPETAVLYTPQELTTEQKAQARANIGAIAYAPTPIVDTVLDVTSGNPVANKAVASEIHWLDDRIGWLEHNGGGGTGGGDGNSVIDVTELPTGDSFKKDCFYRLTTATLITGVYDTFEDRICYVVPSLPDVGDPVTRDIEVAYYNTSDNTVYGYVDDMLSGKIGMPTGWHTLDALSDKLKVNYGGVISHVEDTEVDPHSVYVIIRKTMYFSNGNEITGAFVGNCGDNLYAEVFNGTQNIASGRYSHAEGYYTDSRCDSSHAEGSYTSAKGLASHAEGYETEAVGDNSHTEGRNTRAISISSHAEGCETYAGGIHSHAEGYKSRTYGDNSHAEGYETYANGYHSHAEGRNTSADGIASHTEGRNTRAEGENSHAEGGYTYASGYDSHVEGSSSVAEGNGAHAEGNSTHAKGLASHAEGGNTRADGPHAHAEGLMTHAEGDFSHAEGDTSRAVGACSHAEGYHSVAESPYSHAQGNGTHAVGRSQHVQGEYNIIDERVIPEAPEPDPNGAVYNDGFSFRPVEYDQALDLYWNRGKYAHIVGNGAADAVIYISESTTLELDAENSCYGSLADLPDIINEMFASDGKSKDKSYNITINCEFSVVDENGNVVIDEYENVVKEYRSARFDNLKMKDYVSAQGDTYAYFGDGSLAPYGSPDISDARYPFMLSTNGDVFLNPSAFELEEPYCISVEITKVGRSNAYTLDWDGNGWFAGTVKAGGTGQDDENAKELATKEYLDARIGTLRSTIAILVQRIEALEKNGTGVGGIATTDDGNGNAEIVSWGGMATTDDGNGNVEIVSWGDVSIADDGNGNVSIK